MIKNDAWSKLTMREKANYIRQAVAEGMQSLDSIRDAYNDFDSQLNQ